MKILKARGKLLISAEYMVLHGSQALALPLKKGQTLQKTASENRSRFSWKAWYEGECWFSADFDPFTLGILGSSDPKKAAHLQGLLRAVMEMKPLFQTELIKWDVETRLDFSPSWGLGSSSTLTALLANWAGIDPLDLHFRISHGSGYDVACALADSAIVYGLREDGPHARVVPFRPSFADQLYFVWLGTKQPTSAHLKEMAGRMAPDTRDIHHFTAMTQGMLKARQLSDFRMFMEEHEARLSALIGLERVSKTRFPGLQGSVKSLGAWGGDFVMLASEQDQEALYNYLDGLGLTTRFRYKDLVYDI